MKFKLLLLIFSAVFTVSCSAQNGFWGPKPVPYPGGQFKATTTTLTKNFFKPTINVSATFSNGTSMAGGVGIQWQHDKADAASNTWVPVYTVSAIAFLTTNGKTIGGTGGLVVGIPGTAGIIQLGGGYDFTNKQFVAITGAAIPL
jgi:hypothetical protein